MLPYGPKITGSQLKNSELFNVLIDLNAVNSFKEHHPPTVLCCLKDCRDFYKMISIGVKFIVGSVSNWYILKEACEPQTAWTLAVLAASVSAYNRTRNWWLWDKQLLYPYKNPPNKKNMCFGCFPKEMSFGCIFLTFNTILQLFNNWLIHPPSYTVQVWHACMHLAPEKLPKTVTCLPWEFVSGIILAIFVAIQYQINRIGKQDMQLKKLVKSFNSLRKRYLHTNEQQPLTCADKRHNCSISVLFTLAAVVMLGTTFSYAMISFFTLKTIMVDFINFFAIKINANNSITNASLTYSINLTVSLISIAAGIFQSICTSAIIFSLFNWKNNIQPHINGYKNKGNVAIIYLSMIMNLLYSGINTFMTLICTQDFLNNLNHPSTTNTTNSTLFLETTNNTANGFNCSTHGSSLPSAPTIHYSLATTSLALIIAALQNFPIFFNNTFYNALPNISGAEDSELQKLKEINTEFNPSCYYFKNRGRRSVTDQSLCAMFSNPIKQYKKDESTLYVYDRQTLIEDLKSMRTTHNSP